MDLSGGQQRASGIRRETPNGKLRDFSFVDSRWRGCIRQKHLVGVTTA